MPATTPAPGAVPSRRASPMSTSPDRKHERPAAHLAGFAGCLQVDGYGYPLQSAKPRATRLRWLSAGRTRGGNFFDIQAADPAPIAVETLARIGGLYAIEPAR